MKPCVGAAPDRSPAAPDVLRYGRWSDRQRQRADFHLFWPGDAFQDDRTILIAGCGASQAAKYAVRWPRAHVVGIDVNPTRLDRTEALRRRNALDNLELHRLPVERVAELGLGFDRIVCTGVLHDLPDPDAGLRALDRVLNPGGAIHLMLYAPYGRADIRELADSLLQPRDQPYSTRALFGLLRRNGFRFQRWIHQAPYLPQCGSAATSSHRERLADLPAEEQYAAMELLRGTMVRHSAVVYRDDGPARAHLVDFAGEVWKDYVPVRLPDTVCVEDRLPSGTAGVLINPAHDDPDLRLPIRSEEKHALETVNGKRRIRDISLIAEVGLETARALFERLWWYDQVVFDQSGSKPAARPRTLPAPLSLSTRPRGW